MYNKSNIKIEIQKINNKTGKRIKNFNLKTKNT